MSAGPASSSPAGSKGRPRRRPVNRLRDRIRRLAAEGQPPEEALQRFFDAQDFPVVEGLHCTFAVRVPDADAVTLRHRVVGLVDPLPLRLLAGTDLWYADVEIPPDSRVEYQFEVRRGEHYERFNDPANPRQARGPFGSSSVLHSAGYRTPEWAVHDPDARPGELVETWVRSTAQRRRLSVKPGLTCLWQIRGRNEVTDFRDWVKLDLEYIDKWSLGLDFKILVRTVPAVVFGLGAK